MSQELQMSLTKYLQIKDKLVPKHLAANELQRRKEMVRRQILADSPVDIIRKAKEKYMRPIGEIETIMNHFNSKFANRPVSLTESAGRPKKRREPSVVTEGSSTERQLTTKMSYLLNLPSIGRIKREAERYRGVLNSQRTKEKEVRKLRIMEQFDRYMEAELKGNPKPSLNRRVNTIQ